MGPLAIFDKSFLQSLNHNEAALFDVLFSTNITPIFFMETLAGLSKVNGLREPEKEVGILASKTPTWGSYINASHITMCGGELMGHQVEMSQVPAVAGGRPVEVEGKDGLYFKPSREQIAFERWQDGEFKEVERIMARDWREVVLKAPKIQQIKGGLKFSDLGAIRTFTKDVLLMPQHKWLPFNAGVQSAGFDQRQMWKAIKLWCSMGMPIIAEYAPYINHVVEVDSFFSTAVMAGYISADRASNKIDSAYLYYLPFTKIFISNDNLHALMAPHFLEKGQRFISGHDLKADLKRLVEIFKVHPQIEHVGLAKIASSPPKDDNGLIAQLYDIYRPGWRKTIEISADVLNKDPESHTKIMKQVKAMEAAANQPRMASSPKDFNRENMKMLTIERWISKRRGDWLFLRSDIKDS